MQKHLQHNITPFTKSNYPLMTTGTILGRRHVTVATEKQTVIIQWEKVINIIHHDVAGAVNESGVIPETIEFPPRAEHESWPTGFPRLYFLIYNMNTCPINIKKSDSETY